jgi:hypothetical protein
VLACQCLCEVVRATESVRYVVFSEAKQQRIAGCYVLAYTLPQLDSIYSKFGYVIPFSHGGLVGWRVSGRAGEWWVGVWVGGLAGGGGG